MNWLHKHALAASLAILVGMAAVAVAIAIVIQGWRTPETNLCGTFCDPAYLQYEGSPDASPCLVVNEGPVPSEWRDIKLCYEGSQGDG